LLISVQYYDIHEHQLKDVKFTEIWHGIW